MDAILLVRGVLNWESVTLLVLIVLEHLLALDLEEMVDGSSPTITYKHNSNTK